MPGTRFTGWFLRELVLAGELDEELDEEAAAAIREQMEASLQRLSESAVPVNADEHGHTMWSRCEALTAGKSYKT